MNVHPDLAAGDPRDNNLPTQPDLGFANHLDGKDQVSGIDAIIKLQSVITGLCGLRVDNIDGPQLSAYRVASILDGAVPFIQEMNDVLTEVITTHNQRAANYVHHGWSVGAVETVSPWTSSRIDATNRHNPGGTWITRRTLSVRLRVQVVLQDLTPAPEFVAAIEEALRLPTRFEKFQAVYHTLGRWGDVVPLEMEIGSSLTLTDTEANFSQLPATTFYNSLTHLSAMKTANIIKRGVTSDVGWNDGTWTTINAPASEWRPIRIIVGAPTLRLLANGIQTRLTELYDELLSYVPPLTTHPIGYLWKIDDHTDDASRTISKVVLHSTGHIVGLSVNYLDGATSRAGREAGNVHTFALTNGEHIVEMLTCDSGEWLHGIQFITNKGRCSVIYGILEGIPVISRSKGGILAGFSISSKQHPEWGYLMTSARGIWRYDLIPRVPKENDVYSDYYGARLRHGTGFNDRALIGNSSSMYISSVEVWSGSEIDGIQLTYEDNRDGRNNQLKTERHGGSGGGHHQFKLGDGEYIASISGRYNEQFLTQLCFVTNLGQASEVYGTGSGQSFSARAPLGENGRYLRLQYFIGKSDTKLNGVMFAWTPVLQ
ncbi:unnamed protein product [Rhizoctonia solani]|uniref:Jacalin-type lectin domain-containing protein n=1 Tax=Rhizoctonia solani TaxID=456999 RepID=A0A8H3CQQ2_9AGAM|nr:unnamed protein product [Rhizoctonia solani]